MSKRVLERVREATRDMHEALERRLDILSRMETLEGRKVLAERFHALHAGVEAAIASTLQQLPDLNFEDRRRTALLAADLQALGVAPAPPASIKRAESTAEALGLLYVLEGSSLGGKVIRKQAMARGLDMDGLSFLSPYGEQTGQYWRAFLDVLDRECPEHDLSSGEAAVRGAKAGFAHAQMVLCEGLPS